MVLRKRPDRGLGMAALLALAFLSSTSALADRYGKKHPSVEQAATLFRTACLTTATSFSGFADALRPHGFADDGNGYFVDGVHNMAFQIWKGEGHVFCTLFYSQPLFLATPNASMMRTARTFTEIGVPVWPWDKSRYNAKTRHYQRPIAKDLTYDHRAMDDIDDGHLLRALLAVPDR